MEEDLDKIAAGQIDWVEFLARFYRGREDGQNGLLARIEQELPAIDYPAIPIGKDPESGEPLHVRIGKNYVFVQAGDGGEGKRGTLPVDLLIDELTPDKAAEIIAATSRAREPIGQHPETGEDIFFLVGPFGPYLQLGKGENGQKPKRVSLAKGTQPEDIDLHQATQLLSLPKVIGTDPETDQPVTVGLGRFGPYVERGGVYAKLPSREALFSISLDEALTLVRQKRGKAPLRELGNHPETNQPIQVKDGRYGPYVTDGKINATLKDADPATVTLDEAIALLAAKAGGKRGGARTTKKTSRKTTQKTGKKKTKKAAKKKAAPRKSTKKAASKKTTRKTS
jgi:DNA topoisomerase-1